MTMMFKIKYVFFVFLIFFCSLAAGETTIFNDIESNVTWTIDHSPYVLTSSITIKEGGKLTIEEGVEVQADAHTIKVGSTSSSSGHLDANGVTFSTSQSGDIYPFIRFYYGSGSITDCVFECRVSSDYVGMSGIEVSNDSSPTISGCTFNEPRSYGIEIDDDASPQITGNTFIGHRSGSGNFDTNHGISIRGGSASITGNTIQDCAEAIYNFGDSPTITDNILRNCQIDFHVDAMEPGTISGNTLSESSGRLQVKGEVFKDRTWQGINGIRKYELSGSVTVKTGASLILASGIEIQADAHTIKVGSTSSSRGHLDANGVTFSTSQSGDIYPFIRFYYGSGSITDCVFECRISSDYVGMSGIEVSNDSSPTISGCTFNEPRSYGIDIDDNASPQITGNTFIGHRSDSGNYDTNYGIRVKGGSASIVDCLVRDCEVGIYADDVDLTIENCALMGNEDYGVENHSPTSNTIDARNCWWGHSTGPTHSSNPQGKGDAVSEGVLFSPWLTVPQDFVPTIPSIVITNVAASQRSDGSGLVDCYYDLSEAPASGAPIEIKVSNDGCATYSTIPTSEYLSGDWGTGIRNGRRHIIWDAKSELQEIYWPQARIKISAMDGGFAESNSFLLNTHSGGGEDYLEVADLLYAVYEYQNRLNAYVDQKKTILLDLANPFLGEAEKQSILVEFYDNAPRFQLSQETIEDLQTFFSNQTTQRTSIEIEPAEIGAWIRVRHPQFGLTTFFADDMELDPSLERINLTFQSEKTVVTLAFKDSTSYSFELGLINRFVLINTHLGFWINLPPSDALNISGTLECWVAIGPLLPVIGISEKIVIENFNHSGLDFEIILAPSSLLDPQLISNHSEVRAGIRLGTPNLPALEISAGVSLYASKPVSEIDQDWAEETAELFINNVMNPTEDDINNILYYGIQQYLGTTFGDPLTRDARLNIGIDMGLEIDAIAGGRISTGPSLSCPKTDFESLSENDAEKLAAFFYNDFVLKTYLGNLVHLPSIDHIIGVLVSIPFKSVELLKLLSENIRLSEELSETLSDSFQEHTRFHYGTSLGVVGDLSVLKGSADLGLKGSANLIPFLSLYSFEGDLSKWKNTEVAVGIFAQGQLAGGNILTLFSAVRSDIIFCSIKYRPDMEYEKQPFSVRESPTIIVDNFSDSPIDTDIDEKYDYLRIEMDVNTDTESEYLITGQIYFSDQCLAVNAKRNEPLSIGSNHIVFDFPAIELASTDWSGSLDFGYAIEGAGKTVTAIVPPPYQTASYSSADFEAKPVWFSSDITHRGNNTDSDPLFESLQVKVDIDATEAIEARLSGWLANKNVVVSTSAEIALYPGKETFSLDFDSEKIVASGLLNDCTITLSLYDKEGRFLDLMTEVIPAEGYDTSDFEFSDALLVGSCSSHGENTDGDDYFDFLVVEVETLVKQPGNYHLIGQLADHYGVYDVTTSVNLVEGEQLMELRLSASDIIVTNSTRSFSLQNLLLYNEENVLLSWLHEACNLQDYFPSDFDPPGMGITGFDSVSLPDANQNGLYDSLNMIMNISVTDADYYSCVAYLRCDNGYVIAEIKPTYFDVNETQIEFIFSGISIYRLSSDGVYSINRIMVMKDNEVESWFYGPYDLSYYSYISFEKDLSFNYISPEERWLDLFKLTTVWRETQYSGPNDFYQDSHIDEYDLLEMIRIW